MKMYKLVKNFITNQISDYAMELIDGVPTGVNVNIHTNEEYLAWLDEGNTPEAADA